MRRRIALVLTMAVGLVAFSFWLSSFRNSLGEAVGNNPASSAEIKNFINKKNQPPSVFNVLKNDFQSVFDKQNQEDEGNELFFPSDSTFDLSEFDEEAVFDDPPVPEEEVEGNFLRLPLE